MSYQDSGNCSGGDDNIDSGDGDDTVYDYNPYEGDKIAGNCGIKKVNAEAADNDKNYIRKLYAIIRVECTSVVTA